MKRKREGRGREKRRPLVKKEKKKTTNPT